MAVRINEARQTLAIIGGTGALGTGLAMRWAAAGYPIVLGSRSREKAAAAAREIKFGNGAPPVRGDDNAGAARAADIVVITVPFSNHAAILDEISGAVAGKIVVDTTVPLVPPKVSLVQLPAQGSAALITQERLGASARVVSAFHHVAAAKLRAGACDRLRRACVRQRPRSARRRHRTRRCSRHARYRRRPHCQLGGGRSVDINPDRHQSALQGRWRRHPDHRHVRQHDQFLGAAMAGRHIVLTAVPGIPLIEPGDDIGAIVLESLKRASIVPRDSDVLVIAQKIMSKAEGRYINLRDVVASERAITLAATVGKDPRLIEVILSESQDVVRYAKGVLIVTHRLGFVVANAGVDQSNIDHPGRRRARTAAALESGCLVRLAQGAAGCSF